MSTRSPRYHRFHLGRLVVITTCLLLTRSAVADAPSAHFVVSEGTVLDSATKLAWQRVVPSVSYDWSGADAYCRKLTLQGTGWRLPTIKELQTLIDETRSMPAVDPWAFPDCPSELYWSSSHVVSSPTSAWAVSFRYGFDGAVDVSAPQRVRCVR
jgi:hypothetical protein